MQINTTRMVSSRPTNPPRPGCRDVPVLSSEVYVETSQPSVTQIASTIAAKKPVIPPEPTVLRCVGVAAATGWWKKASAANTNSASTSKPNNNPDARAVGFTPPISNTLATSTHTLPTNAIAIG